MALMQLADLLVQETKTAIYDRGIAVAQSLGLPVTSWQPGDPTRSLYHYLAEILEALEDICVTYISAGFLDWAVERAEETGDSRLLVLLAKQVYDVDAIEATYAETTVTLTNNGGGNYDIEAGDLTFLNTSTGKTYRNVDGGTLTPGPATTLSLTVVADEAGSDSNAAPAEIDDLVTTLLEVTVSNPTAAVGVDAEEPAALAERCRLKLGALSPNGPRDAYNYVARTPELTGTSNVTRSRSIGDSATGDVALYLAGPDGAVAGGDVTLVEAAITKYATPLCITPTVQSASNVAIAVTYQIWLYNSVNKTTGEVQAAISAALLELFRARPIGGDVIAPASGKIYQSLILAAIRGVFPEHTFRVSVAAPAGDTTLTTSQVATLGTVTPTVTFVEDP